MMEMAHASLPEQHSASQRLETVLSLALVLTRSPPLMKDSLEKHPSLIN